MRPMEIAYKLHDSQYQIFHDPARFVILAAGRRYGKTVLALTKAITKALEVKQARIWYVAPTYRQAKMIAWKMLFEMIPARLISKKNEVDLSIILINGSEISLKGADNEDSLRGVSLDGVIMDEYASMKANVWQEIIRPMLADRRGWALFIGTPKGKNHFWELWIKGQRKESGFSSYQMRTEDNPYIPRSEIKEAKAQLNDRYFRQEFEASFEDFTGLIWPEFEQKIHVVDPFDIPNWYETISALDVALSGTTAALNAAIDDDGNIFIVREYYEQNKRASEVSETIRGWKSGRWLIDPASKIKNVQRAGELYALYDEYSDYGIAAQPGENDVGAGINRVAEYFKTKKIKIFSTCKNLIYELERYHWSEERETVLGISRPQPYKHLDHACDALRYLVMSRASEAIKPVPKSKDRAIPFAGELIGEAAVKPWDKWNS